MPLTGLTENDSALLTMSWHLPSINYGSIMTDPSTLYTALAFGLFILLILGTSYLSVSHSAKSHADYFVGSRSFGKIFVALGVGAAGNSGAVMIAAVGFGYSQGMSALIFPFAFFLGDLTFWTFFPHKVNQLSDERDCYTVPELISSAVGTSTGLLVRATAGVLILILVGIFGAAQFYAAGVAIDGVFQSGITSAIIIASIIIVSYSAVGGAKSSVIIGAIHATMMFCTAIGVLACGVILAGGIDQVLAGLRSIDPGLLNPVSGFSTVSLIGYILGFAFAGFGFGLSSPHILTRLFSGKNPDETKSAKWIYLGFLYAVWISTTLFGIVARVLMPDIADPEQSIPVFATTYLNPWLVGLVLAGVFSAIASTADSTLLVFSSSIGVDIAPSFYKKMTERFGNWYRFSIFMIAALIYAYVAIQLTGAFDVMIFVTAAIPASFGPVMLVILLKWNTNSLALVSTMITGFIVSVVWTFAGLNDVIVPAFPGFIAGLVIHFIITGLTPPVESAIDHSD